jgi:hypothetical protein
MHVWTCLCTWVCMYVHLCKGVRAWERTYAACAYVCVHPCVYVYLRGYGCSRECEEGQKFQRPQHGVNDRLEEHQRGCGAGERGGPQNM